MDESCAQNPPVPEFAALHCASVWKWQLVPPSDETEHQLGAVAAFAFMTLSVTRTTRNPTNRMDTPNKDFEAPTICFEHVIIASCDVF